MTVFAASVTRTDLGLGALDINDLVNYQVGSEILGAMVSYERRTANSPYVDGDVTVHRRRGNVAERFSVYVQGATQTEVQNNLAALLAAFQQDTFNLTLLLDSVEYTYQCEASDYQIEWSNAHFFSRKVLVVFNLIRQPIPTVGV